MSVQETKTRQRKRDKKGKYTIRVRYKGHIWKTIDTEDYGSFSEMFKKYKDKYQFWCADSPPERGESAYMEGCSYNGYRLDSDVFPAHEMDTLKRYGKHKAWLDDKYKVDGKPVILVHNAGFSNQDTDICRQKTAEWNRQDVIRWKQKHGIGGQCACCGTTEHLEPDHIVPLFHEVNKGNSLLRLKRATIGSLQTLCARCNRSKNDITSVCKVHGKYLGIWNFLPKILEIDEGELRGEEGFESTVGTRNRSVD